MQLGTYVQLQLLNLGFHAPRDALRGINVRGFETPTRKCDFTVIRVATSLCVTRNGRISRAREVFRQWKRRPISRNPARAGGAFPALGRRQRENFLSSRSTRSRAYGDSKVHPVFAAHRLWSKYTVPIACVISISTFTSRTRVLVNVNSGTSDLFSAPFKDGISR